MLLVGCMLLGLGSSIFHPEVLAHRPARFRRLARPGPVPVSGRRQFRLGARPAGGRVHRPAARADRPRLVRARRTCRHHHPDGLGHWYQRTGMRQRQSNAAPARHPTLSRRHVSKAMAVLIALMFSKYIYLASFTSYYIFYLMDQVRPVDKGRADLSVRVLRRCRGRHGRRRPDRRQTRPQARHLGLDLGRAAVHAGPAPCRPDRDDRAERGDRLRALLGLPGCRRLRTGVDARPCRHGVGPFLRLGLRHRRHGRGVARRAGGLARHGFVFLSVRFCLRSGFSRYFCRTCASTDRRRHNGKRQNG